MDIKVINHIIYVLNLVIIAEEFLVQDKDLDELSVSMVDFKVWCFNGKAESIFVAYNRTNKSLNVDLYDTQWQRLPQKIRSHGIDIVDYDKEFPKPPCLDEMLYIAHKYQRACHKCV